MPIPKPNKQETKEEFHSRCMGNPTMNKEFPDSKKRFAVCQTQWDNKNKAEASWKDIDSLELESNE